MRACNTSTGLALARSGKTRQAMSQFAETILLTPDFAEALNALAWIAATDPHPELRNGAQAVAMAGRACELTNRQQPAMLLTLAAAYAEEGKYDEATSLAIEGRDRAKANGNPEVELKAARMKEIFDGKQPFRESPAATQ